MEKGSIKNLKDKIHGLNTIEVTGKVLSASGIKITGKVPDGRLGDFVEIIPQGSNIPVYAEITGFEEKRAILMPLGNIEGIGPGDKLVKKHSGIRIPCSEKLTGRVLDALGKPMDGKPLPPDIHWENISNKSPSPLLRERITSPLQTGIRVIDGLLTIGIGQRIGLFAGSGVGKSTLLGQIAKYAEADAIIVALVGERGREVREFIEDCLGEKGMQKSIIICSTSDSPAICRYKAVLTATTIAEWFRERGGNVLLLVDSITRMARALREIGLASGETPARRGFPPSVFSTLPQILERAGNSAKGKMTAIYTILVEGGDMDEPVADEVRGILDGHIVLDRKIAERGMFPAIDVLTSISRVMGNIISEKHKKASQWLKSILSIYEQNRDLISLGAYKKGSDPQIDSAIKWISEIEKFLRQDKDEFSPFDKTIENLLSLKQRAGA